MENQYTIFDDVAKDENTLTALFRNFLRFSKFRNKVLELFGAPSSIINSTTFENISIQYSIGEYGRPDLTIVTKEIALYVEIKTNEFRGVTNNQPLGYYNGLLKEKAENKKLIFLIPENYRNKDLIELKLAEKPKGIEYQVISWDLIIEIIKSNKFHETEPLFNEYLIFLEYWFKPKKINFMPNEIKKVFDTDFAKGFDKTGQLLVDLTNKASGIFKHSLEKRNSALYEHGFYLTKNKTQILFVGMWVPAWIETGSPLCICLCDTDTKGNLEVFENLCKKYKLQLKNVTEPGYEPYPCAFFSQEALLAPNNVALIMEIVKDFAAYWELK